MGVAEEADLGKLIGKAGHGVELVHDVSPAGGGIQGAVNDGEVPDLTDHAQRAQPGFVFFGQSPAGPFQGRLGEGIQPDDVGISGGFLVMIALHDGASELLEPVHALAGVGVIPDHVANADVVRCTLLGGIGHDGVKGFQVGVDIAEDCELHRMGTKITDSGRMGWNATVVCLSAEPSRGSGAGRRVRICASPPAWQERGPVCSWMEWQPGRSRLGPFPLRRRHRRQFWPPRGLPL